MKILRVTLALAAAAAVLTPVSMSQARDQTYMQCVRAVEISCGYPFPEDVDAYQECVNTWVPINCGHLPGAPEWP